MTYRACCSPGTRVLRCHQCCGFTDVPYQISLGMAGRGKCGCWSSLCHFWGTEARAAKARMVLREGDSRRLGAVFLCLYLDGQDWPRENVLAPSLMMLILTITPLTPHLVSKLGPQKRFWVSLSFVLSVVMMSKDPCFILQLQVHCKPSVSCSAWEPSPHPATWFLLFYPSRRLGDPAVRMGCRQGIRVFFPLPFNKFQVYL